MTNAIPTIPTERPVLAARPVMITEDPPTQPLLDNIEEAPPIYQQAASPDETNAAKPEGTNKQGWTNERVAEQSKRMKQMHATRRVEREKKEAAGAKPKAARSKAAPKAAQATAAPESSPLAESLDRQCLVIELARLNMFGDIWDTARQEFLLDKRERLALAKAKLDGYLSARVKIYTEGDASPVEEKSYRLA